MEERTLVSGGPLTGDKFKEIVTKYPDKTNQELIRLF